MIFEFCHQLGLVPLLWLVWMRWRGLVLDPGWWWMGVGFGVSWLADTASHWTGHPFVSQLYPVTQAAIFVLVLADKRYVVGIVAAILAAASTSVSARHGDGLDILLHVIAWGAVAALALWRLPHGTLRSALLVWAGLGTLTWMAYVTDPGWISWGSYQATRLAGTVGWCLAAWQGARRLGATR